MLLKLKSDVELSKEQEIAVTGKEDVGYTELKEGKYSTEKLEKVMVEFKDTVEEQPIESNYFILSLQEQIHDIKNPNNAKEYIDAIESTSERAKQYNKELEGNEPQEIKIERTLKFYE